MMYLVIWLSNLEAKFMCYCLVTKMLEISNSLDSENSEKNLQQQYDRGLVWI